MPPVFSLPQPPRLFERWAARLLSAAPDAEAVLGDLADGHAHHCKRRGRGMAALWYGGQVSSLLWHRRRLAGTDAWLPLRPGSGRLGQDLRHAFRGLWRRPGQSIA